MHIPYSPFDMLSVLVVAYMVVAYEHILIQIIIIIINININTNNNNLV